MLSHPAKHSVTSFLCRIVISFQPPVTWSVMDWPMPGKWSVEGKVSRKLGGHLESFMTNTQLAKVLCKKTVA